MRKETFSYFSRLLARFKKRGRTQVHNERKKEIGSGPGSFCFGLILIKEMLCFKLSYNHSLNFTGGHD